MKPAIVDETIEIAPGVVKTVLYNGQIVAFAITDVSRTTVDVFIEAVDEVGASYGMDDLRLTLYDGTHPNLSLTPYFRKRLEELGKKYVNIRGRTAVILSRSFLSHALRLFLILDTKAHRRDYETRIFFTYEEGLAWLVEALP